MNRYVVVVDGEAIGFETMEEAESFANKMLIDRRPFSIERGVSRPILVWCPKAFTDAQEYVKKLAESNG